MIISASRRTDIPAYYTGWMLNRIKEGYVYVRNPINMRLVSKVNLDPALIDCIVFWSKNPLPMLDKLELFDRYTYYFQFTLNPYEEDIENNLPAKQTRIETFKKLSGMIGSQKVIWRYDPVLLNHKYTVQYHIDEFNLLARALKGYTEKVTFSFMDFYKKINSKIRLLGIRDITSEEKHIVAGHFSRAAGENRLAIDTCAEDIGLEQYQISHGRCIDDRLIADITGRDFRSGKDRNQRRECGCIGSVDIGAYNSCPNGCLYCYANYSRHAAERNIERHDTASPFLAGNVNTGDIVKDRIDPKHKPVLT